MNFSLSLKNFCSWRPLIRSSTSSWCLWFGGCYSTLLSFSAFFTFLEPCATLRLTIRFDSSDKLSITVLFLPSYLLPVVCIAWKVDDPVWSFESLRRAVSFIFAFAEPVFKFWVDATEPVPSLLSSARPKDGDYSSISWSDESVSFCPVNSLEGVLPPVKSATWRLREA